MHSTFPKGPTQKVHTQGVEWGGASPCVQLAIISESHCELIATEHSRHRSLELLDESGNLAPITAPSAQLAKITISPAPNTTWRVTHTEYYSLATSMMTQYEYMCVQHCTYMYYCYLCHPQPLCDHHHCCSSHSPPSYHQTPSPLWALSCHRCSLCVFEPETLKTLWTTILITANRATRPHRQVYMYIGLYIDNNPPSAYHGPVYRSFPFPTWTAARPQKQLHCDCPQLPLLPPPSHVGPQLEQGTLDSCSRWHSTVYEYIVYMKPFITF